MKTHTVRNKTKATPLITLTPEFFALLTGKKDWVVRATLGKLVSDVSFLLSKTAVLNLEQYDELQALPRDLDNRPEEYQLRSIFLYGLQAQTPMDPEEVLRLAELLDRKLASNA